MKLFVFDIDNTLVSHCKQESYIPNSTKLAINKIVKLGHKAIIATGRTYNTTQQVMKDVNICDAIICNGSAAIINNELIYNKPIRKEALNHFLKEIKENNYPALAFDSHDIYIYDDIEEKEFFNQQVNTFVNPMFDGTSHKIKRFDFEKEYNSISLFTKTDINSFEDISTTWYDEGGYELMDVDSTKATGIMMYVEKFNFNKEDVYVFGDNYNDISMFKEFYDNSYVLGNACDEVKKFAKNVCKHIDDDGLYCAIDDILN